MASEFTVPKIIQFAEISQYLAANDRSSLWQLQSGSFVGILPNLLYMEGTLLQNLYSLNPGSSTLRGTAEYVLSLCGKYLLQAQQILNNLAGTAPVITGPTAQSVNVGATATFSVAVTGSTPYSYQWLLNGSPIIGATSSSYAVTNAQLSQSGNVYSVQVTNPVTTVTSNTATLTVTTALTANTWYGTTDPGPNLQAQIDNLTYQISTTITHNQPISIAIPQAATPNMFFVTRVPIGESVKTTWNNTALNNGTIPDSIYQTVLQFNSYSYYYTRVQASMDYTQPLILS